jgi:hypothetical protein
MVGFDGIECFQLVHSTTVYAGQEMFFLFFSQSSATLLTQMRFLGPD